MNRNEFWRMIDLALQESDSLFNLAPVLTTVLEQLSTDEIILFVQHQDDLVSESYRYDVWAVAYILNGGCSDDGFEYFRSWLMANGSEKWSSTLAKPESIADWVDWNAMGYEYEDIMYVGVMVYLKKAGEQFPYNKLIRNRPIDPIGIPYREEDLDALYPELSKKRADSWTLPPSF